MREFRKKQKKMKKIMNILLTITIAYILIYYFIQPTLTAAVGTGVTMVVLYIMYGFVLACMVVLFQYTNTYSKCDKFLESVENELSDTGYYYTSRTEKTAEEYSNAVEDDLKEHGYSLSFNETIDEFEFDCVARKKKEYFYIINIDELEKSDIVAYLDSAIYDVTAVNISRKGDGVLMFVCDKADEGAISVSKMITPLGKKEQIKFAIAIVELSSSRVYFLGNQPTKCQQMIANYAMNCEVPIKDEFKGTERMQFQDDLEEHMKDFNLKDFKNGAFFAH